LRRVIDWQSLFEEKCKELAELKRQLHIAETILQTYLPVIGEGNGNDNNEK
jgi:hypothetical protein